MSKDKCKTCGLPASLPLSKIFNVIVNNRKDWPIKPECVSMEGKEFLVRSGWMMDDDDKYPGEHAMLFVDKNVPISWIACGDLKFIKDS